jgi:hypothetical protein
MGLMRENRNTYKVYVRKSELDHLKYLSIDGRLIFYWILNKMGEI